MAVALVIMPNRWVVPEESRRGGGGPLGRKIRARLLTVALHDLEELDNDLGTGSDQDLTLSSLLGIVDGVEGIVENGSANHFGGIVEAEILKSNLEMRYLPMTGKILG